MTRLRLFSCVLLAGSPLFAQSFSYPNFSSTAGLHINGSATTTITADGTVLRLTPAAIGQAGSAFSTRAINFQANADTFSTFFQFRITNPGGVAPADGFVFVIQTQANNVGTGGGGLGYQGISPSVGIEFDTFQNDEADNNHVAVLLDGNVNNGLGDLSPQNPYGVTSCQEPTGVHGCLANGDLWSVWIDYDGTSLHVAVADNSVVRPADLLVQEVSISNLLNQPTDSARSPRAFSRALFSPRDPVAPATSAFVGFTAGTGAGFENHDIVNWQFNNTFMPITGPGTPPPPPPPAIPPVVVSGNPNLGEIPLGHSVSASFSASGGTPPYTWVSSSLPNGFTLTQGSLTGTPTQPGYESFYVQVNDSGGQVALVNVTLGVFAVTTSSLPHATDYTPYTGSVTTTGGTSPYSYSATGLPPGLNFASLGVLSGIPTRSGSYSIAVSVTDGAGVTSGATVALTVAPGALLSGTAGNLAAGVVGTPYSQSVVATGGAPPYTWSLAAGTLPPGLTFSNAGSVSGTPTAAGSFSFSGRLTDSSGGSVVTPISFAVAPQTLTILTPSPLASGMVGVSYPAQILSATGGVSPYSFAITSGSLGVLTLNSLGTISGVPAVAGTLSFTVTATDSAGNTATANFQLPVRSFAPDLILSAGSISFSITTGATAAPPTQSVQVQSSAVGTILPYSVTVSPAVPWLNVFPASGSTPGAFSISLTNQALGMGASGVSPYQATIAVTCSAPAPCANSVQSIPVTLSVSSAPPQLTALPSLLPLATQSSSPQVTSGTLTLQNTGGGSLGISSITTDAPWVSISGIPGSIGAGASSTLAISTNPAGLAAGFYRSTVTIHSSAGSSVVPVTLFIASNASMALEPQGQQFQIAVGGAPGPPTNSFLVDTSSSTGVTWTASVIPGASWLSIASPSGTSTLAQPGSVNYTINPSAAAGLAPGAYYGRIEIASAGVVNTPLDFEVVLNVVANGAQTLAPYPQGLLFITSAGTAPPAQSVQVFANSASSVSFQASASTTDGNAWLEVVPSTSSATPGTPTQTVIAVNPGSLAPGVYYGGVSYAFASAGVRTVNVTLLVEAAGSTPHISNATGSCTPTQLVPAAMGPAGNFAAPAAWPTPISIQLLDNCANPLPDGQIVATFSNGDPPLALSVANNSSALYVGTWTPRKASSQVAINATAAHAGFPTVTAQVLGLVAPNNAPLLTPGGILNAFTAQLGSGLAPGTIVQVYGTYLGAQGTPASTIPLPTTLSGSSLLIGGIQAPLYYTSSGQINAQIPFELTTGNQYQVIGVANGALTTPVAIQLTPASPGLDSFPAGTVIAQHSNGNLVSETSPAQPGEILVAYVAGFGATGTPVASGAASPSNPLAQPLIAPTITINSQSASILFAGLTPGLVGLYQINFQVPATAPNGDLPLILSQGGVAGNATILPVHN